MDLGALSMEREIWAVIILTGKCSQLQHTQVVQIRILPKYHFDQVTFFNLPMFKWNFLADQSLLSLSLLNLPATPKS